MAVQKVDSQILNAALMGPVLDVLKNTCNVDYTHDPEVETRDAEVEKGRMEISGWRRVYVQCFISVVYFYYSHREMEKKNPCGAIVFYIRDAASEPLVKAMSNADIDHPDDKMTQDRYGEFCHQVAGAFKQEFLDLGHRDFALSKPYGYKDIVPGGIKCHPKLKEYYALDLFLWDMRAIAIDLVLSF